MEIPMPPAFVAPKDNARHFPGRKLMERTIRGGQLLISQAQVSPQVSY
jgi:hypothetical protein